MGGLGSGERFWTRKRCVEHCDSLDTARLRKWGWLVVGDARGGPVAWERGGEVCSEIDLTANLIDPDGAFVALRYWIDGERVEYLVALDRTFLPFGGQRWWFRCPLVTDGGPCRRRVRKLYRVAKYFACRDCHDLTYQSRQAHHARLARLVKDPRQVWGLIDSGSTAAMLLGVRAAVRLEERNQCLGGRCRR
jgi:hypothetical protein